MRHPIVEGTVPWLFIGLRLLALAFDVTWSGSRFVAVGRSTGAVSSDSLTWQLFGQGVLGQSAPPFGLFASGVATDGQAYIAVGDAFGQIERSTDGLNWIETAAMTGAAHGVGWGNSRFVAVGQYGEIFTSP